MKCLRQLIDDSYKRWCWTRPPYNTYTQHRSFNDSIKALETYLKCIMWNAMAEIVWCSESTSSLLPLLKTQMESICSLCFDILPPMLCTFHVLNINLKCDMYFLYTHWWVLVLSKNSCDDRSFLRIGCHQACIQVLGKDGGEVIHVLNTKRDRCISYVLVIKHDLVSTVQNVQMHSCRLTG